MHSPGKTPPLMKPAPGDRVVRYVGDRLRFEVSHKGGSHRGWKALLRTNLTRGLRYREETIALAGAEASGVRTFAGASWRDIPLAATSHGWCLDLPLTETGYFRAKAYLLDPAGHQHWPEGNDLGISVLPDHLRTGNTIYCAFPRMFGANRVARTTSIPSLNTQLSELDERGFTVIPPSGKLRDLLGYVPHIVETLGCRILHLLPLGPTPTTYARMGRFGSPYAQLDMAAIDPALVEFDRRTTAEDQFRELAYAVHLRGGLVFLDIVINHTGWGSRLMEKHPEWFKRNPDGTFHSPGAWGVTWEDLVELDQVHAALWETIAGSLVTWCRRGVDGFRCDAGYMVPVPAWQYLLARVRREFPDTAFLLEGLGGPWDATEALLTEGGMQWAYSELFQNHGPVEVAGYVDHANRQAQRMGPLVHYSETHDNARLAAKGAQWSLMRNRLCALASHSGAFGFTSGVEWLATEQIRVHESRGLAWGGAENLVQDLARLNRLLRDHPCFHDGASVTRLSKDDSAILALHRVSATGEDACLVLVNLDPASAHGITFSADTWRTTGAPTVDLLAQRPPEIHLAPDGTATVLLGPAASYCLSVERQPKGLSGDAYRTRRAQAAWAYRHLSQMIPPEALGPASWLELATLAGSDPAAFLAALPHLDREAASRNLLTALHGALAHEAGYAPVVRWDLTDLQRVTVIPPDHWLLIEDASPFAITLRRTHRRDLNLRSVPSDASHFIAIFPAHLNPGSEGSDQADLLFERFAACGTQAHGALWLAPRQPHVNLTSPEGLVLLTNARGGMARVHVDLGRITSKYDCLLGANLHPDSPCDRHVLVKRLRAWANADGFITSLDRGNLLGFHTGPPATWHFAAHAGDGRLAHLALSIVMEPGLNVVRLRLERLSEGDVGLDARHTVRVTLRLDLEDRSFHQETVCDPASEAHFTAHTRVLPDRSGFAFAPEETRRLEAWSTMGTYHPEPEWAWNLSHAVEASRGMRGSGDAWSPGWFELPLEPGTPVEVIISAEGPMEQAPWPAQMPEADFEATLRRACGAFLAQRGTGRTVIAGYPWFLDWGRDTLIACRGLLAAGWTEDVTTILRTFARFEDKGTLPNMLSAESTANRETSDAPLWFALACEEAANRLGQGLLTDPLEDRRTLRDVLRSIGLHHIQGTPTGVKVDPASGLVWSPPHYTWMDTNHPAGTPRMGYPVELQALWIRCLGFLARLDPKGPWASWLAKATASLDLFWLDEQGHFTDVLVGAQQVAAAQARADGHLRPNQLFLISLGLVKGQRARRAVSACTRHLLVPGGMRSLAPLPVPEPLPIHGPGGALLNDPWRPYWGRYDGDEDTRRKPAYHNGTVWVWPLGTYAEALAQAWEHAPAAQAAARAILGTCDHLLAEGCLGQLPEILDGDAPHTARGCDAQAWSATEVLRVWLQLAEP